MRRASAGLPVEILALHEGYFLLPASRIVRDRRVGAITVSDDRIKYREVLLRKDFALCSPRQCGRAWSRQGLIGHKPSNRVTFRVVCRQKLPSCLPADNGCEFPSEILRTLDGGINAESFVTGHRVCGISHQKYPPHSELLCYTLGRLPVDDVHDLDGHVRLSDCLLDQFPAS